MLESDVDFRLRIKMVLPSYFQSLVHTATGHRLDVVGEVYGLVRKPLATNNNVV